MSFARINDELRRNTQRSQCMPEFIGLRGRTFSVVFTDDHQRRRFHVFDELDRRALFVNGWIVVNRGAEKRDHPLVDQVLPIITLPIRNAGSGDSRAEAVCLGDCPHGHETAVTPAHNPESRRIDWIFFNRSVDACEIVAQITVAKIFHIGASKIFALSIAATRIWQQHEIAIR